MCLFMASQCMLSLSLASMHPASKYYPIFCVPFCPPLHQEVFKSSSKIHSLPSLPTATGLIQTLFISCLNNSSSFPYLFVVSPGYSLQNHFCMVRGTFMLKSYGGSSCKVPAYLSILIFLHPHTPDK